MGGDESGIRRIRRPSRRWSGPGVRPAEEQERPTTMSHARRRVAEPPEATWLGESRRLVLGFAAVVVVGLGVLLWPGSDESSEESGDAAPQALAPGRFVLTDASWGAVADSAPEPEESDENGQSFVLDFGEERRRQLAEEARERWQNLDIAIRR